MATITNTGTQAVTIEGQRVKPGGTLEVTGAIPRSIAILVELGALSVEGDSGEGKMKIKSVDNPEDVKVSIVTPEQQASAQDQRIIEVMRNLPEDSFMGDGRPEVRAVNGELAKLEINNISADERDRIWALAKEQKAE